MAGELRDEDGVTVGAQRAVLGLQPLAPPQRVASAICVRRMETSRAFSHGFATKSRAPRRMASTARSTLAQAVMTTTGSVGSRVRRLSSRSSPSCPDVVSRA